MSYTAKDIKVMSEDTVDHPWVRATRISNTYKIDLQLVKRALEVLDILGIPDSYYVEKYCEKQTIPVIPEVESLYREKLINNTWEW